MFPAASFALKGSLDHAFDTGNDQYSNNSASLSSITSPIHCWKVEMFCWHSFILPQDYPLARGVQRSA
jgi:hypothetical protein